MQVVEFAAHGPAAVLRFADRPMPAPGAGEVLLKVVAAGVNYVDIWQRLGTSPRPVALPYVPGMEVAGTVAALGTGVTTLALGQRVMAMLPSGGYAAYALATTAQAIALPDDLPYAEATALLAQGPTAVGLLNTGPYASVLVLAAAGGVGSMLVQVARNRGLRVVAAVGSPAKMPTAQALGADAVVCYADPDWVAQVRAATDGQGVAAVFDAVGGRLGTEALAALAAGGTAVVYGTSSGEPTALTGQQLMGLGQAVRGYSLFTEMPRLPAYLAELLAYRQAGRLQLPVQTYPVADVQAAQAAIEARQTQGKVVLLFE